MNTDGMTAKEEAIHLIERGYYGGELDIEELIARLDGAIRSIQECNHQEES